MINERLLRKISVLGAILTLIIFRSGINQNISDKIHQKNITQAGKSHVKFSENVQNENASIYYQDKKIIFNSGHYASCNSVVRLNIEPISASRNTSENQEESESYQCSYNGNTFVCPTAVGAKILKRIYALPTNKAYKLCHVVKNKNSNESYFVECYNMKIVHGSDAEQSRPFEVLVNNEGSGNYFACGDPYKIKVEVFSVSGKKLSKETTISSFIGNNSVSLEIEKALLNLKTKGKAEAVITMHKNLLHKESFIQNRLLEKETARNVNVKIRVV